MPRLSHNTAQLWNCRKLKTYIGGAIPTGPSWRLISIRLEQGTFQCGAAGVIVHAAKRELKLKWFCSSCFASPSVSDEPPRREGWPDTPTQKPQQSGLSLHVLLYLLQLLLLCPQGACQHPFTYSSIVWRWHQSQMSRWQIAKVILYMMFQ